MQFFADESDKTLSDSFKIKLEVLIFEFKSDYKINSENENKINNKVKEILKIIKK